MDAAAIHAGVGRICWRMMCATEGGAGGCRKEKRRARVVREGAGRRGHVPAVSQQGQALVESNGGTSGSTGCGVRQTR